MIPIITRYIVSVALITAAGVVAIGNAVSVIAWHVAIPFSDEWNVFPLMIGLQDAGWPVKDVLFFLWEQHSEHRIVVPKIIYLIDMICFSYKGYFPLVCIFLFQAMLVGMLAWLLVNRNRSLLINVSLVCLAVFACFGLIQYENFLSTFQTSFIGCFAFAVSALVLYTKSVANKRKCYLFGTVLFAILTSLSLASGLFVWIALAILAYFLHEKVYTRPLIFMGVFVVFLMFYLHGYKSPVWHASPANSIIHHPFTVSNYLAVWLGGVTGKVSSARLLGLVGLLALIGINIILVQSKNRGGRTEVYTLIGISMFVLMTGFVTSLGRINFGVDQALASRYATPVMVFWCCQLSCILLFALETRSLLFIRSSVALILSVILGLLVFNNHSEQAMIVFQNQQNEAYLDIVTGAYNGQSQLLLPIYPKPDLIIDKISLLKSHHLSSFSESGANTYNIGGLFDGGQQVSHCKGRVDSVTTIAKNTYRVTGWAWDEELSNYPEWIFLVKSGNLIGLGKSGYIRPDVVKAIPSIDKIRVGWIGIVRGTDDIRVGNINAYISSKSGEYCHI